jgi:Putative transposase of IS4/5 family (DUF4096)
VFWQLALVVERRAAQILGWSGWRRWHQSWARYYHARRRARQQPARAAVLEGAGGSTTIEAVWQRLAAVLAAAPRRGRPWTHDRRKLLEAMVYVMERGCRWPDLPAHFPPWKTVHGQLARWRQAGIWDAIWLGLDSCDVQL